MNENLKIYKQLQNTNGNAWSIGIDILMYNSVDSFIDKPTDEEYETITNVCYRAYMKADECDFIRLTDKVAYEYSQGNITLDELKEMSPYQLLDKMLY